MKTLKPFAHVNPATVDEASAAMNGGKASLISGGTDLNGCFALGNPMGPVYAGELQCRGLAMKVFAFDDDGQPVVGQEGELVCTAPFPSMPIYFWNDEDGQRYQNAYFTKYPGIWTHGDFISINSQTKGITIYGRSDATLSLAAAMRAGGDVFVSDDGDTSDWEEAAEAARTVVKAVAVRRFMVRRVVGSFLLRESRRVGPSTIPGVRDQPLPRGVGD